MKAKVRHLWEVVAGAILSLLGFSACDIIEHTFFPVCEYGMPHADYKLTGEVKSESGNPVEGIKVTYRHNEGSYTNEEGQVEEYWHEEEFFTDSEGKVSAALNDWQTQADGIQVVLEDVDGPENGGEFETQVLSGSGLNIKFAEDDESTWHTGDYVISFSASLQEKK